MHYHYLIMETEKPRLGDLLEVTQLVSGIVSLELTVSPIALHTLILREAMETMAWFLCGENLLYYVVFQNF